MTIYRVCITPRSTPTRAVADTNPICFIIYHDDLPPQLPFPPPPEDWGGFNPLPWGWGVRPEPWGQIQALGVILQGISALPERNSVRQELHDTARKALEAAVEELGDGVHLVEEEVRRA